MSTIAALSVQSLTRRPAVVAAAPVVAHAVKAAEKTAHHVAKDLAPALSLVARGALAALIEAEAHGGNRTQAHGHTDPRPGHGHDDDHGHQLPPVEPPQVQPPVVQPPVVQPPVTEPPVVAPPPEPPAPQPIPAADPAMPARAIALIERTLSEGRTAQAERSAFAAAAAGRRAAAVVAQGQAALAVLSALQSDMASYRAQALGRYETAGRLA